MTTAVYQALSYAMRYWFIAVAIGLLVALIRISYREYKDKKSVKSNLSQFIGYLDVVGGPGEFIGQRFGVREITVIGRSTRDDIVLADPTVAPSQVRIRMTGDKLILEPSRKGYTTVNGKEAPPQRVLKTGDKIGIGDVTFSLHIRRRRIGYDT